MKSIRHILSGKPIDKLFTISRHATVYEALTLMMEQNVSAVLITDGAKLEGIFTERDYARKIALKGKTSKEVIISEVMSTELLTITPQFSIEHCMQIMTDKHIRHLPVLENNQLIGIISIGDLVKFVIADQKHTITELESYIHG
ncbi:CBS domain-containing protein [Pseudopedobacter beijingensis]|uniref:CBS domain-containing protein n=1 Tax=Pseudopedobacter beijingensis TaxID=1207056 RepID=A0ABW4IBB2_9SPHI